MEVVYPLSKNTVLAVQQIFSNLLSAAFVPVFKALRNVGTGRGLNVDELSRAEGKEVPQYTFSFYMLIIIHTAVTCYFMSFNGSYLRYEAKLEKKARKEEEKERMLADLHEKHASGQLTGYGAVEHN